MEELLKKYPLRQEFVATHSANVNPEVKHILGELAD